MLNARPCYYFELGRFNPLSLSLHSCQLWFYTARKFTSSKSNTLFAGSPTTMHKFALSHFLGEGKYNVKRVPIFHPVTFHGRIFDYMKVMHRFGFDPVHGMQLQHGTSTLTAFANRCQRRLVI